MFSRVSAEASMSTFAAATTGQPVTIADHKDHKDDLKDHKDVKDVKDVKDAKEDVKDAKENVKDIKEDKVHDWSKYLKAPTQPLTPMCPMCGLVSCVDADMCKLNACRLKYKDIPKSHLDQEFDYDRTYYRCMRADRTHHGFTYRTGLNFDTKEFNSEDSCCEGGLYFTSISYVRRFSSRGSMVQKIKIPRGIPVVRDSCEEPGIKYRAPAMLCVSEPIRWKEPMRERNPNETPEQWNRAVDDYEDDDHTSLRRDIEWLRILGPEAFLINSEKYPNVYRELLILIAMTCASTYNEVSLRPELKAAMLKHEQAVVNALSWITVDAVDKDCAGFICEFLSDVIRRRSKNHVTTDVKSDVTTDVKNDVTTYVKSNNKVVIHNEDFGNRLFRLTRVLDAIITGSWALSTLLDPSPRQSLEKQFKFQNDVDVILGFEEFWIFRAAVKHSNVLDVLLNSSLTEDLLKEKTGDDPVLHSMLSRVETYCIPKGDDKLIKMTLYQLKRDVKPTEFYDSAFVSVMPSVMFDGTSYHADLGLCRNNVCVNMSQVLNGYVPNSKGANWAYISVLLRCIKYMSQNFVSTNLDEVIAAVAKQFSDVNETVGTVGLATLAAINANS